MLRSNRELWLAFFVILLISSIYLFLVNYLGGIPAARGFWGHGMGILGFTLMLMTEILYSWRKRSPHARWGRMSTWLRMHIFMGLVGPYMVLLHTSWKFNGLAGIVMLLTVIIVISGVIGRYIYTAIPRTVDGTEVETAELARHIAVIEDSLRKLETSRPEISRTLSQSIRRNAIKADSSAQFFLFRFISDFDDQIRLWQAKRRIDPHYRIEATELGSLLRRKRQLQRQASSLIAARRLLSLWHAVHIPIGMILFATTFVHIIGAVYYATLLR